MTDPAVPPPSRSPWLALLPILAAVAVAGGATLPFLGAEHHLGDCGELATVIAEPGIAHPPGYPLYTMLGHAWGTVLRSLFGGPWVLWTNAFSWFGVLVAAALAAWIPVLATAPAERPSPLAQTLAAAIGAGFWCVTPAALRCAVVTEVYGMHWALLGLGWVLLAVGWREDLVRSFRGAVLWVLALGLVVGCAGAHHLTYVLFVPAGLLVSWRVARRALPARVLPWVAFLGCGTAATALGLSSYVYLWVRSGQGPYMNWGNPGADWQAFLSHVTARQYEGALGLRQEALRQAGRLVLVERVTYGLGTALLLLMGAVAVGGLRHWRRSGVLPAGAGFLGLLVLHAGSIFVFNHFYNIGDIQDYFPAAWLLLAMGIGVGTALAAPRLGRWSVPVLAAWCGVQALLAWPNIAFFRGELAGDRVMVARIQALWDALPEERAVVLMNNDAVGVLHYYHAVNRSKPQVLVLHRNSSLLDRKGFRRAMEKLGMDPILLYDDRAITDPTLLFDGSELFVREVQRNIDERCPYPVYRLDPVGPSLARRSKEPPYDYALRLREEGMLPEGYDIAPKYALLGKLVEKLRNRASKPAEGFFE